jgi:Glycosyltransferase family 87
MSYMVPNTLYTAVWVVVTATLAAYLLRVPFPTWWGRLVATLGLSFFLTASVATACGPLIAYDFHSFWEFGGAILAGEDPTAFVATHPLPPLNPPTAFPLFASFSLLPFQASLVLWVTVSASLCVALVPLSLRTLADRGVPGVGELPRWAVALAAAGFVISNAPRSMLQSGQLAAAGSFGLLAAVAAQSAGRPGWAGFWLVPGTIKPNSALPFLLLFHRRRDWKTWVVASVLCVAACLAAGWARDPVARMSLYLKTVARHGKPGGVNDYSFHGPQTAGMVGLDYALFRLGFRAPGAAGRAQLVVLALIGVPLSIRILRRPDALPTGGDCAQIALYSTIFLYHRTHDFVIIALPFSYALARSRVALGLPRAGYLVAAFAILLALSQQRKGVELLEAALKDRSDLIAHVLQAVVLPYATWLILVAMAALALADRRESVSAEITSPTSTPVGVIER